MYPLRAVSLPALKGVAEIFLSALSVNQMSTPLQSNTAGDDGIFSLSTRSTVPGLRIFQFTHTDVTPRASPSNARVHKKTTLQ
eukprot:CCRYP_011597-RA/>CCRYP_011597-RA protein AED:0.46 eAED:0.57 QI:276/0/0.5/1/0/0/2/0/82